MLSCVIHFCLPLKNLERAYYFNKEPGLFFLILNATCPREIVVRGGHPSWVDRVCDGKSASGFLPFELFNKLKAFRGVLS